MANQSSHTVWSGTVSSLYLSPLSKCISISPSPSFTHSSMYHIFHLPLTTLSSVCLSSSCSQSFSTIFLSLHLPLSLPLSLLTSLSSSFLSPLHVSLLLISLSSSRLS